ncbi:hypothetical protein BH10ACT3_BH10ACT3_21470 [soil metagenome]
MTQRMWFQVPDVHPLLGRDRHRTGRLHLGRAPVALITDELTVIAERRTADPPAPGTARPAIRLVTPDDRAAIVEMAARCSTETLRRRFHGPMGDAPATRVADLLQWGGRDTDHLVAVGDGAVVGMGSLNIGRGGDGEIAVLVEDAWQGSGVGRRLTSHLLRRGSERGMATILADVLREPSFVLEQLHRAIAASSVDYDGPTATVRIPLAAVACAAGPPTSAGAPTPTAPA